MSRKTQKVVRKQSKSKSDSQPGAIHTWWVGLPNDTRQSLMRGSLYGLGGIALLVLAIWAMCRLEGYALDNGRQQAQILQIRFTDQPDWMPAQLARTIAGTLIEQDDQYQDDDLTQFAYQRASQNAWVKQVELVKKYRGKDGQPVVELSCRFRKPMAIVKWNNDLVYVDADGVRLPDSPQCPQVPKWEASVADPSGMVTRRERFIDAASVPQGVRPWRIPYITILLHGQLDPRTPEVGEPWGSPALLDGLRLAELLYQKPYSQQITRIDVRNFDGRESRNLEHLGIWAKQTYIKFGRFQHADGVRDYELSPEVKMTNLDRYVANHDGKLAGTRDVDLQIELAEYATFGSNVERR